MNRREFLKGLLATTAAVTLPMSALEQLQAWAAEAPEAPCTLDELDEMLKSIYIGEPLAASLVRDTELMNLFHADCLDAMQGRLCRVHVHYWETDLRSALARSRGVEHDELPPPPPAL